MSTPGGLVDKQELIDAQLDTAHLGRVVNSKDASGNPITTSTNRTGGKNRTLDALEADYLEAIQGTGGIPIGTWTAGVTTFNAFNEYAVYNGIPYKPRTSATLPYVAQGSDPTAAPDDANVQPYQEITEAQVVALVEATIPEEIPKYTDIVYKASGGNSAVENMIAGIPISASVGDYCRASGTVFIRISDTNNDISDYQPITEINVLSFVSGSYGFPNNDDQAFIDANAACVATGGTLLIPNLLNNVWNVGNVTISEGVNVNSVTFGDREYTRPATINDMLGTGYVNRRSGSAHGLNFAGRNTLNDVRLVNFESRDCHGLSQSSSIDSMILNRVSIIGFDRGFGTAGTVGNSRATNCHATANNDGCFGWVDGHVTNCEFNANENRGVASLNGHNDTTYLGNKVEWNNGYNWEFFGSGNRSNNVTGGVCDRAGLAGARIAGGAQVQMSNIRFRRNGRLIKGDVRCAHFVLEGAGSKLYFETPTTETGQDDTPTGDITPDYVICYGDNQADYVSIENGSFTGYEVGVESQTQNSPVGKVISGVEGINDFDNVGTEQVFNGKRFISTNFQTVNAGTSVNFPLTLPSIGTFRIESFNIELVSRSTTTVDRASAIVNVHQVREGAAASVTVEQTITQSSASFIDPSNLQLTINNVSSDGGSFDLSIQNNESYNQQIRVYIY